MSAASPAAHCRAALPHGLARVVPAPIVFKTGCGGFRLDPSGRVTRLPRGWFADHSGGTGRRFGADLQIRRNRAGRVMILSRGRLVWRSSGLYPNDGGSVAFGPGIFAFASYNRGVFLTDLNSPERLVVAGRGRYPYDFFASGRMIVDGGGVIAVLSPQGRIERRYPYSRRGGYTFDADSNTLSFVTPRRRLATIRESRLRVGRRLGVDGMISFEKPGLLLFYGGRSLTVTDRTGRLVAGARWPHARLNVFDSGATVSTDGRRIAFRLSDARPGAREGTAVLYVLTAGEGSAQPVYRHRLGPRGCGVAASMRWHGRHLLYRSSEGQIAIVDGGSRRRHDLAPLAKALPRRSAAEQPTVAWLSNYPRRS